MSLKAPLKVPLIATLKVLTNNTALNKVPKGTFNKRL